MRSFLHTESVWESDGCCRRQCEQIMNMNTVLTILPMAGLVFTGILNNVGFSEMAYAMPAYPSYLLYGTTVIYVLMFLVVAVVRKENPFSKENMSWGRQKHMLLLGLLTALNGLCAQFSAPWVDGATSQVIANFGIPQVAVFQWLLLKKQHSRRAWISTSIVFLGVLIGMVPAIERIVSGKAQTTGVEQSDASWWVITFLVSTTFQALEYVAQDYAWDDQPGDWQASCLFWYNFYSLFVYLFVIPLDSVPYINGKTTGTTVAESFVHQGDAWRCAYGDPSQEAVSNGDCRLPAAIYWPWIFNLGYTGDFFFNALVMHKYDSLYSNIVGALIQPASLLVFMWKGVVGAENVVDFNAWPLVGCIIVVVGVAWGGFTKRKSQTTPRDEEISLIGRTGSDSSMEYDV